jgi:hypothetical protein
MIHAALLVAAVLFLGAVAVWLVVFLGGWLLVLLQFIATRGRRGKNLD